MGREQRGSRGDAETGATSPGMRGDGRGRAAAEPTLRLLLRGGKQHEAEAFFAGGQDHRAWLKACERQPLAARQLLVRRRLFPVQQLGQPGTYWGSRAGRAASFLPVPASLPASVPPAAALPGGR